MKLRNKFIAGFAATVLALSMMVGTAMAQTDKLPYDLPNEANAPTSNDLWVKLIGGGDVISTADVAANVRTVDVTITGKATFDAEFIYNSNGGWVPTSIPGQSVDGKLVLTMPMDGSKASSYCEIIVNLKNKSAGPLSVAMMEFKDKDGKVLLTHGKVETVKETAPVKETPAKDEVIAAPEDVVEDDFVEEDVVDTDDEDFDEDFEEDFEEDAEEDAEEDEVAEDVAKTDAPAKKDVPAKKAVPKTGVESFGAIYGIAAALLASGAVALRRKQK